MPVAITITEEQLVKLLQETADCLSKYSNELEGEASMMVNYQLGKIEATLALCLPKEPTVGEKAIASGIKRTLTQLSENLDDRATALYLIEDLKMLTTPQEKRDA